MNRVLLFLNGFRVVAARRGLLPSVPDAARLIFSGLVDARLAWAIFFLIPILYVGASAAERRALHPGQ